MRIFKPSFRLALAIALPLLLVALLWRAASKRPRHLTGLGGQVTALAWSPDGKMIVCASDNDYVQVWLPDTEKWRSYQRADGSGSTAPQRILRLKFSPDSNALFGGGVSFAQNFTIPLTKWNAHTRRREFRFTYTLIPAWDISNDGRLAVSALSNGIVLTDLTKTMPVSPSVRSNNPQGYRFFKMKSLPILRSAITALALSPDGNLLASGDSSGGLALWDVKTTSLKMNPTTPPQTASASPFGALSASGVQWLQWSPDGRYVAGVIHNSIALWKADGTLIGSAPLATNSVNSSPNEVTLAWSPDGKTLASGGGAIELWSVPELKLQRTIAVSGPMAFSPDGKTLASGGQNGAHEVLLWRL